MRKEIATVKCPECGFFRVSKPIVRLNDEDKRDYYWRRYTKDNVRRVAAVLGKDCPKCGTKMHFRGWRWLEVVPDVETER